MNFSMKEIARTQFTDSCWCWKHILLIVQQLAQVVMYSYLFPVSQTRYSAKSAIANFSSKLGIPSYEAWPAVFHQD